MNLVEESADDPVNKLVNIAGGLRAHALHRLGTFVVETMAKESARKA